MENGDLTGYVLGQESGGGGGDPCQDVRMTSFKMEDVMKESGISQTALGLEVLLQSSQIPGQITKDVVFRIWAVSSQP